ncbi:persephin [Pelobates cultripes]|nr:persephin [Pelobates cultripes]
MRCEKQLWVALFFSMLGRAALVALDTRRAYGVALNKIGFHQDAGEISSLYDDRTKPRVRRRLAQPGRPRTDERECRLKTLLLQVGDLGLGYDSEETVLFKYCGGGCPRSRTNHDLTLSRLLQKSDQPSLLEDKIFGGPCCRPTHYEDVAFLDDRHRWHTVEQLSAAACGCVG